MIRTGARTIVISLAMGGLLSCVYVFTELLIGALLLEQRYSVGDFIGIVGYHAPFFVASAALGAALDFFRGPGARTGWIGAFAATLGAAMVVLPRLEALAEPSLGGLGALGLAGAFLAVGATAGVLVLGWLSARTRGEALCLGAGLAVLASATVFVGINEADARSVFEPGLLASAVASCAALTAGLIGLAWLGRTVPGLASLLALGMAGAFTVGLGPGRPGDPPTASASGRPNVVLICIDTLRADRLDIYDYEETTAPRLAAFGRQGVVFENAISASNWTRPSVASLFTSLEPSAHGVNDYESGLAESMGTAAEIFRGAGYRTLGVVANIQLNSFFGFSQGFDEYVELHTPPISYVTALANGPANTPLHWIRDGLRSDEGIGYATRADRVNRAALERLEPDGRPLFLYLHYLDPHQPYDPPAEHEARFHPSRSRNYNFEMLQSGGVAGSEALFTELERRYLAEIHYTDTMIGELLDDLEGRGLLENAVVAVVADHGEAFGDHDDFGHGHTLYDEQVRIPFLLWGSGVPKGRRVREPVTLLDVLPTLLAYAGIQVPEGLRGSSLRSRVASGAEEKPTVVLTEKPGEYAALRGRDWKLIRLEPEALDTRGTQNHAHREAIEYYELDEDPGELRNLADVLPAEQLAALLAELARAREGLSAQAERRTVEVDEETREALRALGYTE